MQSVIPERLGEHGSEWEAQFLCTLGAASSFAFHLVSPIFPDLKLATRETIESVAEIRTQDVDPAFPVYPTHLLVRLRFASFTDATPFFGIAKQYNLTLWQQQLETAFVILLTT